MNNRKTGQMMCQRDTEVTLIAGTDSFSWATCPKRVICHTDKNAVQIRMPYR